MKAYIAGPMRGIKDFNFPAFFAAEEQLRAKGYTEVFNPARRDCNQHSPETFQSEAGELADIEKKGFNLRDALSVDLAWICKNADEVVMLPGWEASKGATAEYFTAQALGLKVSTYEGV